MRRAGLGRSRLVLLARFAGSPAPMQEGVGHDGVGAGEVVAICCTRTSWAARRGRRPGRAPRPGRRCRRGAAKSEADEHAASTASAEPARGALEGAGERAAPAGRGAGRRAAARAGPAARPAGRRPPGGRTTVWLTEPLRPRSRPAPRAGRRARLRTGRRRASPVESSSGASSSGRRRRRPASSSRSSGSSSRSCSRVGSSTSRRRQAWRPIAASRTFRAKRPFPKPSPRGVAARISRNRSRHGGRRRVVGVRGQPHEDLDAARRRCSRRRSIVVRNRLASPGLREEAVHRRRVAGDDDDEVVAVVLHLLDQGVDGLRRRTGRRPGCTPRRRRARRRWPARRPPAS